MERLQFLKTCGVACLGGIAMASALQGCASVRILERNIEGDDLIVPLEDFELVVKEEKKFKRYILVQNQRLKYPICIFRNEDQHYQAVWMRCTHQGTELQVLGDKLQCPAHGSEFSKDGNFTNGPADKPLRTFPVLLASNHLKISLKAV